MSSNTSRRKRSKNRKKENQSRHTRSRFAGSSGSTSRDGDYIVPEASSSALNVSVNQESSSPITQRNMGFSSPQSGGIGTHATQFGARPNFNAAAGIAFGSGSTATHNSYNIQIVQSPMYDKDRSLVQVDKGSMSVQLAFPDGTMERYAKSQSKTDLPHAKAAYNDYMSLKGNTGCLKGTREALLKEIEDWSKVVGTSQIYVLCGLAGIGKSTVAYTIAQGADGLGLLGASFFFSRNESERRTAEKFFTTIAFHLCVYNTEFAGAIGKVLATDQGKSATTKDPGTQLNTLIIAPLRDLVQSRTHPVVIVVDALDECEDNEAQVILRALSHLVYEIPSFKVLLTTRPQPHLDHLLSSHNVFHLHNIEDKIVNNDIRNYLRFSLSMEQVESRLPGLSKPWNATEDDIDTLVQAAGKLFIVASVSVLYILDKFARNPASRMKMLRSGLASNHTPLRALDGFYSIILNTVIPPDSDRDLVERFKTVIGSIVLLNNPLPVDALAHLIDVPEEDIYAVLDNMQSVILRGTDRIPYIYHKSFSDWIMDPEHCKNQDYYIDPRDSHTRLTIRCLQTMNKCLKQNILGITQFWINHNSLELVDMNQRMQNEISSVLRYACISWTDHLGNANVDNGDLMDNLKTFADEHLLHWIEALSWIGKIFSVLLGLSDILRSLQRSALADLRDLLSDALRFLSKFGPLIAASALITYHSALPFTPTESLLYTRYKKEILHNKCRVQGGPRKWDAVITSLNHGQPIDRIVFDKPASFNTFASGSAEIIRFWNSTTGTYRGSIANNTNALASNLRIAAGSRNTSIFVYDLLNILSITTIKVSSPALGLALSFDGCRLAARLSDGSVNLWAVGESTLIGSFDVRGLDNRSSHEPCQLTFSPNGNRLAYTLASGGVTLRNEIDGQHIADLNCNSARAHCLLFSPQGSQLASLVVEDDEVYTLALWNSIDGKFLGAARDVGSELAFSVDESLIATGGSNNAMMLWDGNNKDQGLRPIETPHLGSIGSIRCLAFSQDGMLAIGSADKVILYDVANRSFITSILIPKPTVIAFSDECTRLAAGTHEGVVRLLDVPTIKASTQMSQKTSVSVSALMFSPDCSRLVSGSEAGIIRVWDTNCTSEPITTYEGHFAKITTLAFTPNGGRFCSGDANGTIKLWSVDDWILSDTVQWPISGVLTSVAVSPYLLAGATMDSIALWDLSKSCMIDRLGEGGSKFLTLSNDDETLLLASFDEHSNNVTVWDVWNRTPLAMFNVGNVIERPLFVRMVFVPDNSHIFVHLHNDSNCVWLFDIVNKVFPNDRGFCDLTDRGLVPCWKGTPVFMECSDNCYFIRGWFIQDDGNYACAIVCYLPEDIDVVKVAYGSSMFAVICQNGDLILLQSN